MSNVRAASASFTVSLPPKIQVRSHAFACVGHGFILRSGQMSIDDWLGHMDTDEVLEAIRD